MKRIKTFLVIAVVLAAASVILPAPAEAYPYVSRQCTDCHMLDSNVVVAAEPLGCTVRNGQTLASYDYRVTVSNTYESLEGFAVFDGLPTSTTNIKYGYGPATGGVDIVISLNQNKTYTIRGTSDSDYSTIGGGKGGGQRGLRGRLEKGLVVVNGIEPGTHREGDRDGGRDPDGQACRHAGEAKPHENLRDPAP